MPNGPGSCAPSAPSWPGAATTSASSGRVNPACCTPSPAPAAPPSAYPGARWRAGAGPGWMEERPGQTVGAVTDGVIVGWAKRGANRPGRGSQVATASFLVDPARQGQGTAPASFDHPEHGLV